MDATDDHQKHRPRFVSLGTTYISLSPDGKWLGIRKWISAKEPVVFKLQKIKVQSMHV